MVDKEIVFDGKRTSVKGIPSQALEAHKKRIAHLTGQKVSDEDGILYVNGNFVLILKNEFEFRGMQTR